MQRSTQTIVEEVLQSHQAKTRVVHTVKIGHFTIQRVTTLGTHDCAHNLVTRCTRGQNRF